MNPHLKYNPDLSANVGSSAAYKVVCAPDTVVFRNGHASGLKINLCEQLTLHFQETLHCSQKLELLPGNALENAHMPCNFGINQARMYSIHSHAGAF